MTADKQLVEESFRVKEVSADTNTVGIERIRVGPLTC